MELLTQYIETIIDKLILAQNIYYKSAKRVHFDPMKDLFNDLMEHKKLMLTELANATDLDVDDYSLSTAERVKLEIEKMGIELDHLMIKNNYNETLSFCIKRERELMEAYVNTLKEQEYDLDLESLLKRQSVQTQEILDRLEKRHEAGDFKKW